MSTLTQFFPDSRYIYNIPQTYGNLYVYNGNTGGAVQDGGKCCLWVVPAGVAWAKFEVWGAGGDGGGACCCQQPSQGGGSGTYSRKTIRVVPGQCYLICAGGSGCCAVDAHGTSGFPSFAQGAGTVTYSLNLCASGGYGGQSCCWAAIGGNYHCATNVCGCACGYDLAICGVTGASHEGWCGYDSWHMMGSPTYIGAGTRTSFTECGESWMGCAMSGNFNAWPGGGGGTAISYGGCCWGGWGSGGLVQVTYR